MFGALLCEQSRRRDVLAYFLGLPTHYLFAPIPVG
jgi:hypothetical protein